MHKLAQTAILALLLLGLLILPACQPPQPETTPTTETETETPASSSDIPASDTELSTTAEEAPAGNTRSGE